MDIRKGLLRSIPAVGLAVAMTAGTASLSKAQTMGDVGFAEYHGAIRAYELCNDVTFDQDAYKALERAIQEQTATTMSVGESLSTIDQAQSEAFDMVFKYRCDSEPVGRLLALFQSDLAPAVM
jgi:hypothetical protein